MARAGHDYEFFSSFAKDPFVDVEMSHGGCRSCPVAACDPESGLWEGPEEGALPLQLAPGAREGKYLWLKQHESMEVGILA